MAQNDTIFAFATPPGVSGVAVLRVSGPKAGAFYRALSKKPALPKARFATLAKLYHPQTDEQIDEALAIYFAAPNSFTGEEVLELHLHGSHAIRGAVFDVCISEKLRLAEPGEFMRRAFANNKMDLLQIEGYADILSAGTPKQLQQAWRQADGSMGAKLLVTRSEIMRPLALLEAYIDFPDEEIPQSVLAETKHAINGMRKKISGWLADERLGEKLREGFEIIILGAPNVGKSSLINWFAKRPMAIVTDEPGTTRDMIELHLDVAGYPVTLIDTAGLRKTQQKVEAIGVANAQERAANADLILALFSNDTIAEQSLEALGFEEVSTIKILSKCDIGKDAKPSMFDLEISTKTDVGLSALLSAIEEHLAKLSENYQSPMITRARHRQLLQTALTELDSIKDDLELEFYCEHLRHAATAIGNITGKIHQDELLDIIFKEFCIGK